MASSASITVSFGDQTDAAAAADAHLSAEIDNRPTGLNGGTTNFKPGDTVWFLVYKSDNVAIDGMPISSAGDIGGNMAVTGITKVQETTFANTDTASIQVPATSINSASKWLGRTLGALTLIGNNTTVKAASKGVAVNKLSYQCDATAFSLTSPTVLDAETSFSIAIVVNGILI